MKQFVTFYAPISKLLFHVKHFVTLLLPRCETFLFHTDYFVSRETFLNSPLKDLFHVKHFVSFHTMFFAIFVSRETKVLILTLSPAYLFGITPKVIHNSLWITRQNYCQAFLFSFLGCHSDADHGASNTGDSINQVPCHSRGGGNLLGAGFPPPRE